MPPVYIGGIFFCIPAAPRCCISAVLYMFFKVISLAASPAVKTKIVSILFKTNQLVFLSKLKILVFLIYSSQYFSNGKRKADYSYGSRCIFCVGRDQKKSQIIG